MTVWTIDAEPGTGGRAIARELAHRADVPLVDEQFTLALAIDLGTSVEAAREYERAVPWMVRHALLIGMAARPGPEMALELRRLEDARQAVGRVVREAARTPCVIFGRCAFELLASHPGALHARLWAPLRWRVERAARSGCSSTAVARRRLIRAERDRLRANRWLLRRRGPDAPVHVVCDASRLSPTAIVELLLAAAGREAATEEPVALEGVAP
jgi:Cytidylate kinase-like family